MCLLPQPRVGASLGLLSLPGDALVPAHVFIATRGGCPRGVGGGDGFGEFSFLGGDGVRRRRSGDPRRRGNLFEFLRAARRRLRRLRPRGGLDVAEARLGVVGGGARGVRLGGPFAFLFLGVPTQPVNLSGEMRLASLVRLALDPRRLRRRPRGLLLAGVPQRLERVRVVAHGRLETSNLPFGAIPRALRLRQPSAELLLDVRRARPQRPDRVTRRLLGARSILLRLGRRRQLRRLPRLALRPRRRLRLPQLRLGRVPSRLCQLCRLCQLRRARLQLPLLRLRQRDDALDLGVQRLAAFAALGVHRRVGSSNGIAKLAKLRLRRVRLTSQPLEFRASSRLSLSLDPRAFASNPVRRVRLGVSGEVPQGLHLRLQGLFAAPRGFEGVGSLGANRVLRFAE